MSKPVKIYTTKTCGYCKAAKDLFQTNNIPYTEVDVTSDPLLQREMIEKSGQLGVPVIIVGAGNEEEVIIGYDRERLGASLGINAQQE